jgi:hypothetical protein
VLITKAWRPMEACGDKTQRILKFDTFILIQLCRSVASQPTLCQQQKLCSFNLDANNLCAITWKKQGRSIHGLLVIFCRCWPHRTEDNEQIQAYSELLAGIKKDYKSNTSQKSHHSEILLNFDRLYPQWKSLLYPLDKKFRQTRSAQSMPLTEKRPNALY